ncbi:IclR family transcriptional regulator [Actinomadura rugatobispora]|uniref:IclR family transcriptional regulator n=1 Tax=Actinomadura rugatobispora TaxID=1994 RepID=A0ABW0ZQU6_9ACTN
MSPAHRNEGEISAVGRAAALLKEFRTGDGTLTAAALVRRTGLPKSTVHRMLRELVRVELLEQVGGTYRLGLLVFELGRRTPRESGLHEAAHPHMAALHEATRHNVGLAVLADDDVVYVDMFRGRDAPRLPQRTGTRWPAHASCSGKAILAFSGAEGPGTGPLRRFTEHTIIDRDAFAAELERVRRRGVAYDLRESFPNVVGVASPIMGADGEVAGALSMSGLAGRISLTRVEAAVRAAALAVTRRLAGERLPAAHPPSRSTR